MLREYPNLALDGIKLAENFRNFSIRILSQDDVFFYFPSFPFFPIVIRQKIVRNLINFIWEDKDGGER